MLCWKYSPVIRSYFINNFSRAYKCVLLYKRTAQQPGLLWYRPLHPTQILRIPAGNQQLMYLWNVLFELYKSLQPSRHSAKKNCQVQFFLRFNIIQVLLFPTPIAPTTSLLPEMDYTLCIYKYIKKEPFLWSILNDF